MDKNILKEIYSKDVYLNYLRYHPKWYYYIDSNKENFKVFKEVVKKEYKLKATDHLEKVKTQISFVSALLNYWKK